MTLPTSFLGEQSEAKRQPRNKAKKQKLLKPASSSWDHIKNLLSCKQMEVSRVHEPCNSKVAGYSKSKQIGSSCSSIYSFRDVVHGNTRVVDNSSPENSSRSLQAHLDTVSASSRKTNTSSSSRGMQLRKLTGCYECHMILHPTSSRLPIPRSTVCACSHCGQLFPKMESLELHQAVRHAVSELGPEDSGRNIVEIIFKSSWLKKDSPLCKIERILKVHNNQRTIQRFEDCRDAVKARALTNTKKNPRCAADGNELLRFYCTTLTCALGARGASALCSSVPGCGVCTIIRHGFQGKSGGGGECCKGVWTTASSGRAHDSVHCGESRRAMLVCRVIAGRVKPVPEEQSVSAGSYDSVAGYAGVYSNLEELVVLNPWAILPCFVVIYKVL